MKKLFLAGIVALAMGFAFVSCNSGSKSDAPVDIKTDGTAVEVMTDIVAKAKADGANWTVDQWKYVFKQAAIAIKPMMVELSEATKNVGDMSEEDAAALAEKFQSYQPIEDLMDEFTKIAESTPNGKIVNDDDDFEKQLTEELGLPDL